MTNEIGGFKLEEVSPGKYDLSIESTGYEKNDSSKSIDCSSKYGKKILDF